MSSMAPDNTAQDLPVEERPLFSATITPHRSLSPRGFLILMCGIGGISFVSGMMFLMMGAWPVFGFFGLDALLVYIAFRANYRSAAAYEIVTVTPNELTVRKVDAHGHAREWMLNPLWVRLHQEIHPEFGVEALSLVSRGRHLPIAAFLGRKERGRFAQALNTALAAARRGPDRNVF